MPQRRTMQTCGRSTSSDVHSSGYLGPAPRMARGPKSAITGSHRPTYSITSSARLAMVGAIVRLNQERRIRKDDVDIHAEKLGGEINSELW